MSVIAYQPVEIMAVKMSICCQALIHREALYCPACGVKQEVLPEKKKEDGGSS